MAVVAFQSLVFGENDHGGRQNPRRRPQNAKRVAACLRNPCSKFRRSAESAFQVDGAWISRSYRHLRQCRGRRTTQHRRSDVGLNNPEIDKVQFAKV